MKTIAALASVASRASALERVVESLLPQVDLLGVYLNGYDEVPQTLCHERIDVVRSQRYGDKRDLGKFYWQPSWGGLYLSCDDDLVYPPWYVEHMRRELGDRDVMRSIVTMHGYDGTKIEKRIVYSCLERVIATREVLVGGTGVMAHFAPALKLEQSLSDDRADMWISRLAHQQGLRTFVLEHDAMVFQYLEPASGTTLWDESARDGHKRYNELLRLVLDAAQRHRRD